MRRAGPRSKASRPESREIDGVLLLDKPIGITSHSAVQRVRRLFKARKAGHTGTLDPLATGLLPVCLGEATKFSHALLDADKTYLATIRLGMTTTTGDLEGEKTSETPVAIGESQLISVLGQFLGQIAQVPPMYSAIKQGGQPLYKLARAGREVPRAPRRVWIRELRFIRFVPPDLEVAVTCSKGTYIRVLAEDIGRALGCGGCLAGLRRTAVGDLLRGFDLVSLQALEATPEEKRAALLLPEDTLLAALPRLDLNVEQAVRLVRGQQVNPVQTPRPGPVRVYGPEGRFLGLAEVIEEGCVVPRRLRQTGGTPACEAAGSIA